MASRPSDATLLLAVAERDMGAFRTLYERHAGWLAIRLARWCNDRAAYLPACSHGSTRAKHGRSNPSSSARIRRPSPAPILTAPAALDPVVVTHA